MFKPATTAFLITAALTSALATPVVVTGSASAVEAREPFAFRPGTCDGCALRNPSITPLLAKVAREETEVDARGIAGKIGGQVAGGVGGAAASWLLNKLRDEDSAEAREEARRLNFVNKTPVFSSFPKAMAREDVDARGIAGKIGGQVAGGVGGAAASWLLNKLRDEDSTEAREDSVEARYMNFVNKTPIFASLPKAIAREDVDARGIAGKIGGQVAGGVGGAAASWLLNKLRDEDSTEAREDSLEARLMAFVNKTPVFPSGPRMISREYLEARGAAGKALTSVGGQAAGGAAGALTTWALNKIKREELEEVREYLEELEARGAAGKALTSVGGQAAGGAASALTTWALNKIHRRDLEEAREDDVDARAFNFNWGKFRPQPAMARAIEELLERDDEEYMEAREFFENYLEARDYDLEDLE